MYLIPIGNVSTGKHAYMQLEVLPFLQYFGKAGFQESQLLTTGSMNIMLNKDVANVLP